MQTHVAIDVALVSIQEKIRIALQEAKKCHISWNIGHFMECCRTMNVKPKRKGQVRQVNEHKSDGMMTCMHSVLEMTNLQSMTLKLVRFQ